MIVGIPKDIDATEARVFKGLSLKKMGFGALGIAAVLFCLFGLHLPMFVSAVPGAIIFFLGFYSKQGMPAWVIAHRVIQSYISRQEYFGEVIATTKVLSEEDMQQNATEWNKELRRQKKRHPGTEFVKTVRCTTSKKSRK